MDEVERSRQELFLTIPCIPAIHGGQMPEPRTASGTAVEGGVVDKQHAGEVARVANLLLMYFMSFHLSGAWSKANGSSG
jgi:hypothetical protein